MKQLQQAARETEPVLFRTTIHWVSLLGPAALFMIGLIIFRVRPIPALVIAAAAVIWGAASVCNVLFSELTITANKLTVRTGFPFKRLYESPYALITYTDIHQPPLGRVLSFGKITIVQSDGQWMVFKAVANPGEFIARLRQELARYREDNDPDAAGAAK